MHKKWEKQSTNSTPTLIVWRSSVWRAELMPCSGASFFDKKLWSARLPPAHVTWGTSLEGDWNTWRFSIWYLTTDWSHSVSTSSALSSSIHENSLPVLLFPLFDTSINCLYLRVLKKQTNWISISKEKKKKTRKSVGLLAFALTCFNTGKNPEQPCWF